MPSWTDVIKASPPDQAPAPPDQAPAPSSGTSWTDAIKPPASASPPTSAHSNAASPSFGASLWNAINHPILSNADLDTSSPAAAALAAQRDPTWKPTGNPIMDLMTYPRAKTEGVGEATRDTALSATDALSGTYARRFLPPQAISQAETNLGILNPAVQGIAYAAGPGKLLGPLARRAVGVTGLGVDASANLAARTAASMASTGLENAGASAYGTMGSGGSWSDVAKNAGVSFLTGTLGGVFGGSGPTPKAPEVGTPSKSGGVAPTGMYATKEAEYAPLNSIYFNKNAYAGPVNQATTALRQQADPLGWGLTGTQLGITPEIQKIVSDVANQPFATGRILQQASHDLRNLDNGKNPIAHHFAQAFDDTLTSAQPAPGSLYKGASAQIGDAGMAQRKGNLWYGRIKDMETLGDDPNAIPNGAIKAVQEASPLNAPKANTPQSNALLALYQARQPGFNWWTAKHIAGPLIGAAGLGIEGAVNPAEAQNPWISGAREALEGALLFKGGHSLAAPRPAAALNAARYAIGTGQPISNWQQPVGNALVNLMAGHAASGQQP